MHELVYCLTFAVRIVIDCYDMLLLRFGVKRCSISAILSQRTKCISSCVE